MWSDFVLEHIENPKISFKEIYRVLKPGAPFYFRTPNIYHYVSVISKLTPHWFHVFVVKTLCSLPEDSHEAYRTFYRANSRSDLLKLAQKAGFNKIDLRFIEMEPSYLLFNELAFYLGLTYERLVNKFDALKCFRANIFGKLTK